MSRLMFLARSSQGVAPEGWAYKTGLVERASVYTANSELLNKRMAMLQKIQPKPPTGVSSVHVSFDSKEWIFMGPTRSPELVDECNRMASGLEKLLFLEPFVKMFFSRGPEPSEADGFRLVCRHEP